MGDDRGNGRLGGVRAPLSAKAAREAKLAQALRDNLRRRKGAPVARPTTAPSPGEDD